MKRAATSTPPIPDAALALDALVRKLAPLVAEAELVLARLRAGAAEKPDEFDELDDETLAALGLERVRDTAA